MKNKKKSLFKKQNKKVKDKLEVKCSLAALCIVSLFELLAGQSLKEYIFSNIIIVNIFSLFMLNMLMSSTPWSSGKSHKV